MTDSASNSIPYATDGNGSSHAPAPATPRKKRSPLMIWLRRGLGIIITVAIFYGILRPVWEKWPEVSDRIMATHWSLFFLAAALFALFLFTFRAMAWRHIVKGFGHRLPVAATVRIWSTSELARYLPGVIWQVIGRVYLVKPYGVSATVCSASQVLELTVFLLANILMAVICLLYLGVYNMGHEARPYFFTMMAIVPVLLIVLHPKIFYGLMNRIMRRIGKPPITQRLSGRSLVMLVIWSMLGLLLQSLAIFLITSGPLGLPWKKWWVVAGAYCLAWCGGFLAFWAPGGLGVREFLFVFAMEFALPARFREPFKSDLTLRGFLAFLGVLLRLWATLGELILAALAYAIDFRGALGYTHLTATSASPPNNPLPQKPLLAKSPD